MTKHLIQSIFILLTVFYLFPNTILAIDCNILIANCPTGDASLGVNFTGLQPMDLNAGTFRVSISSSSTYSCTYPGGTAGNSGSCPASYDGSNISCQINHVDCRNQPFAVSVSTPTGAGYTCTASTTSVSLNNCFKNDPITVNCTPPINPISAICKVSNVTINTDSSVTWSTSNPQGGNGTYSYVWSGTDNLSGSNQSVIKTYTTAGTKDAAVTITSGSQTLILTSADCPTVTVGCTPVCPNSSDVSCGTALGSDGCGGSCAGTGTKCPTNYACTTSGCQLKCGPWSYICGAVTRTCDDGSTQNAILGPCNQGSCNVDSASATGTSTGTASVTCL